MTNIILEKGRNLSESEAFSAVKTCLKKELGFLNGFIYINCPNVSDLFIIRNRSIRKCYDKEWNKYYNEYLI